MPSTIKRLLIAITLLLSVSAYAAITVGGISEDGDSGLNSRTLQTVGAVASRSIIVMVASQGQLCDWTAVSWSGGTATATLTGSDASSCKSVPNNTWICVGHVLPAGYNGCFQTTGSSATTMQYAVADPGGSGTQFGGASIDPVTPTDNAGNTYVFVTRTYVSVAMYIASNIALAAGSAQPTLTCALQTGELGVTCGTITVSGLATSSPLDQVSTYVQRTGVTTVVTQSIGGNFTPEFIVAFSGLFNLTGNTVSAQCGVTFTNFDTGNHDGVGGYPPAYFITSSLNTYCAGLSQNSSGDAWPIIASFKGAGATGTLPDYAIGKAFAQGKSYAQ